MKPELFLIKDILQGGNIHNVLDVGAGKGYASLLCASYGAVVDAVDNQSQKIFSFPPLLLNHPSIIFHHENIEDTIFVKKYDLVIATNIIMFINKEIFIETLFAKLIESTNNNGHLIFSYFLDSNRTDEIGSSKYVINDFSSPGISIVKSFEKQIEEDHPPYGNHTHHIQYLVLKKVL